jgi:L-fuconolactonase
MPDFPIVDTHVHFWDRSIVPVSWMQGLSIDRPFLPADLSADAGGVDIESIVFVEADVEPGQHIAEADWVASLADEDPRIKAIVAHAPLERPDVPRDLETLAARPMVRGIRRLIQASDAEALCGSAGFRDGVRRLASFGLHFEICILHHQLAPALDLVRACPDVHFVLDHIAKPGIAAGIREPWWQQMAEMAAMQNVTCKLSGVATEADHANWTEDQLRPYIDRVIEVFGPGRIVFGSDWPVMKLATSYPRWVAIVDSALSGMSEADRRRIFAENAKAVYRL